MDALGLINLALMRIGERAIADVAADSTTARVASQFFRHSVDEVTTEHQWTFAKKRIQLTTNKSVVLEVSETAITGDEITASKIDVEVLDGSTWVAIPQTFTVENGEIAESLAVVQDAIGWTSGTVQIYCHDHNLTQYEFVYDVPADALRVLSMVEDEQFIIESGRIYSDAENPTIVYLATLVTEGDTGAGEDKFTIPGGLPPKFLEATACRLGMKIGTKIGADGQIMGMLAQEYRFLLQQAMNNDAMDSPGKEDDQVAWWYEG